jgi:hypothetical protein
MPKAPPSMARQSLSIAYFAFETSESKSVEESSADLAHDHGIL